MRGPRAALLAATSGAACMALELTAVRLLAPHFGDSAYVWTNVIGVILLALAVGAWFGGRLAMRVGGRALGPLLGTAAILTALVPLVAGPLSSWLLPQELPLDAAMPAMVRGSLFATTVLFAPPVFLLGAISPLLVTAAVSGGAEVGRAAGGIAAAGTIGSLVGTFAATHWLVPGLGCRLTMWGCAVVLAGAGLLARPSRALAVALFVVLPAALLQGGPLRAPVAGAELLAERESRYQYLQVLRRPAGGAPLGDGSRGDVGARIELQINEGLDSFHSVAILGSAFTGGAYYDWHAVVPLLAGSGSVPEELRALSIGDAAGTFRRIYAALFPGAVVDAVELDPQAAALGSLFPGETATGRMVTDLDGRVFVERSEARWHVVHVDAYAHQVYIPAHLASREFFAAVEQRLLPSGIVACNVGGLRADDPVLQAIGGTMAEVFGEAVALQVPGSRNFLLLARRGARVDPGVLADPAAAATTGAGLGTADRDHWHGVLQRAAETRRWVRIPPADAAVALRDDRPELDLLLHQSYVAAMTSAPLLPIDGAEDAAAVEGLAHAALGGGDPAAVLATIRRSRRETPYLRYLAGFSRWHLHDLRAAKQEYEQALALGPEPGLRAQLAAGIDELERQLGPRDLAAATAARNGWLAATALLLLLAAGAVVWRS